MSKFYTVVQNNSGGYYIENEDVGVYLIVEANTPEEAEEKVDTITEPYLEYCECCGERWWVYFDDKDGKDKPEIYGRDAYENGNSVVIYYLDGRKDILNIK